MVSKHESSLSTPPSPGRKEVPRIPPSDLPATAALVGTADHVIPPAELLAVAQHAQAHIVKVDASHLSMISHPAAVTRLIVAATRGTS